MEKPVPPSAYFTLLKICSLRMTMTSSGFFFLWVSSGEKRVNNREVEIVQ